MSQEVGSRRTPVSEVFIARQPIFDPHQKVYGYELLFRSGLDNVFSNVNPDQATAKVMTDSTLLLTMASLSGGKMAFINITRDILLKQYVHLLPSGSTAVEIPEIIQPDPEVLHACRRLKEAGYLLVLDDFVFREEYGALMEMADIVKVDVLSTPPEERRKVLLRFEGSDVRFLAEKVETQENFEQAVALGYDYFQGYFFSKPTIISARDVPGYKLNYLRMLKEIQSVDIDFHRVEPVIKHDMALAFKLLRYINSAYFGLTNKVNSILHAMLLLGPWQFKQWASLLIMASMGNDKPDELVIQGLNRGRFCELLAPKFGMTHQSEELFLLGMFSLMGAILNRPLAEILQELPLTDWTKAALLGMPNRSRDVLDYVVAYERGNWEKMREITELLQIDESGVYILYQAALQWAEQSFEEVRAADQEEMPRAWTLKP
jgi:EAL and modified HD-GYP domain-containing signal transduction protein